MENKMYTVGRIVNTHGIRGETKVISSTDFPELRFEKGSVLHILQPGERVPAATVEVERARMQKNTYIVKFKQFDNINDVEKFKGALLKITASQQAELPQNEYYFHEIVGCKVLTEDGEELGTVSEILTPGANDVWVVQRPAGKPVLLPVIDEVVLNVDVQNRKITVHLMEGLI
ncbi:ribosome maturation factor RimM [Ferviditalea candida]|uniref:Ribosome maturation factor RimM n=1 Tax=Ferviditalea candida TaxID=3108399 RepID=A0ABU5ZH62_9BACL|nr:ribosome maturation factor RimM [Paenibacillaceae bacterium T2]